MAQTNRDQVVTWLAAIFQRRYEPNFAWKSCVAAHLALPGLRGFWPMSGFNTTAGATDMSGFGFTMTAGGNPEYAWDDLIPYVYLDGNDHLHVLDTGAGGPFDVTGTETYVRAIQQGLTFGGWFYRVGIAGTNALMAKWLTVGDHRSYRLLGLAGGTIQAGFSSDGTAGGATYQASTNAIAAGEWFHAVARFDPGAENAVFLNGVESSAATANAQVADKDAQLDIGAQNDGTTDYLYGFASMCWVCCERHSDSIIKALFEQTRAMYRV